MNLCTFYIWVAVAIDLHTISSEAYRKQKIQVPPRFSNLVDQSRGNAHLERLLRLSEKEKLKETQGNDSSDIGEKNVPFTNRENEPNIRTNSINLNNERNKHGNSSSHYDANRKSVYKLKAHEMKKKHNDMPKTLNDLSINRSRVEGTQGDTGPLTLKKKHKFVSTNSNDSSVTGHQKKDSFSQTQGEGDLLLNRSKYAPMGDSTVKRERDRNENKQGDNENMLYHEQSFKTGNENLSASSNGYRVKIPPDKVIGKRSLRVNRKHKTVSKKLRDPFAITHRDKKPSTNINRERGPYKFRKRNKHLKKELNKTRKHRGAHLSRKRHLQIKSFEKTQKPMRNKQKTMRNKQKTMRKKQKPMRNKQKTMRKKQKPDRKHQDNGMEQKRIKPNDTLKKSKTSTAVKDREKRIKPNKKKAKRPSEKFKNLVLKSRNKNMKKHLKKLDAHNNKIASVGKHRSKGKKAYDQKIRNNVKISSAGNRQDMKTNRKETKGNHQDMKTNKKETKGRGNNLKELHAKKNDGKSIEIREKKAKDPSKKFKTLVKYNRGKVMSTDKMETKGLGKKIADRKHQDNGMKQKRIKPNDTLKKSKTSTAMNDREKRIKPNKKKAKRPSEKFKNLVLKSRNKNSRSNKIASDRKHRSKGKKIRHNLKISSAGNRQDMKTNRKETIGRSNNLNELHAHQNGGKGIKSRKKKAKDPSKKFKNLAVKYHRDKAKMDTKGSGKKISDRYRENGRKQKGMKPNDTLKKSKTSPAMKYIEKQIKPNKKKAKRPSEKLKNPALKTSRNKDMKKHNQKPGGHSSKIASVRKHRSKGKKAYKQKPKYNGMQSHNTKPIGRNKNLGNNDNQKKIEKIVQNILSSWRPTYQELDEFEKSMKEMKEYEKIMRNNIQSAKQKPGKKVIIIGNAQADNPSSHKEAVVAKVHTWKTKVATYKQPNKVVKSVEKHVIIDKGRPRHKKNENGVVNIKTSLPTAHKPLDSAVIRNMTGKQKLIIVGNSRQSEPKVARSHLATETGNASVLSDKTLWVGALVGWGLSSIIFILCCLLYKALLHYRSRLLKPLGGKTDMLKISDSDTSKMHIELSEKRVDRNGNSQYVVSIMGKKDMELDSSSEEEEVFNRSVVDNNNNSFRNSPSFKRTSTPLSTPTKTKKSRKPLLQ